MARTKTKTTPDLFPLPRSLWLAGLGFYGRLYDEAAKRTETPRTRIENLLSGYIEKGEEVEKETRKAVGKVQKGAQANLKEARSSLENRVRGVQTTLEERVEKLRDVLPFPTFVPGTRVRELESEIARLTKKVNALGRSSKKPATRTSRKAA